MGATSLAIHLNKAHTTLSPLKGSSRPSQTSMLLHPEDRIPHNIRRKAGTRRHHTMAATSFLRAIIKAMRLLQGHLRRKLTNTALLRHALPAVLVSALLRRALPNFHNGFMSGIECPVAARPTWKWAHNHSANPHTLSS